MAARRPVVACLLSLVALLLTGCVVVGTAPPGTTVGDAPSPQSPPGGGAGPPEQLMARAIFDRVNAERTARGIEELAWNEQLAEVARDWSADMAQQGVLQHQDLGQVMQREELGGFEGIGENIFHATGPVPAGTIHVGWMRSDDHRVNVLNPGWDRIGIGVHCAEDGSVWATQEFGRTVGSDRPALSSEPPPQEPITQAEEGGPGCG